MLSLSLWDLLWLLQAPSQCCDVRFFQWHQLLWLGPSHASTHAQSSTVGFSHRWASLPATSFGTFSACDYGEDYDSWERRCLLHIMVIIWLHMSLDIVLIGLGLMRMLMLVQFLWPIWRIDFLLRLWSLWGLIRCGLCNRYKPTRQSTFLAAIRQEQFLCQGDATIVAFFDQLSTIWHQIDTLGP
jgi:hypothetical protein